MPSSNNSRWIKVDLMLAMGLYQNAMHETTLQQNKSIYDEHLAKHCHDTDLLSRIEGMEGRAVEQLRRYMALQCQIYPRQRAQGDTFDPVSRAFLLLNPAALSNRDMGTLLNMSTAHCAQRRSDFKSRHPEGKKVYGFDASDDGDHPAPLWMPKGRALKSRPWPICPDTGRYFHEHGQFKRLRESPFFRFHAEVWAMHRYADILDAHGYTECPITAVNRFQFSELTCENLIKHSEIQYLIRAYRMLAQRDTSIGQRSQKSGISLPYIIDHPTSDSMLLACYVQRHYGPYEKEPGNTVKSMSVGEMVYLLEEEAYDKFEFDTLNDFADKYGLRRLGMTGDQGMRRDRNIKQTLL